MGEKKGWTTFLPNVVAGFKSFSLFCLVNNKLFKFDYIKYNKLFFF